VPHVGEVADPMSLTPLRALAPAKINLGLFVGPLCADGRHELVSVMQSISLADELTLAPAAPGAQADELDCPGIDGYPRENLAMRALAAFREASGWEAPPLRVTVAKRVPLAAGLGGGSGDAAAVLRMCAAASGLGSTTLLHEVAVSLGADVPAQVQPGRWLARGVGERLTELPDDGASFGVLVLPSEQPLSTAEVYTRLDQVGGARTPEELDRYADELAAALAALGPGLPHTDLLHNDLQAPALALCPSIESALQQAQAAGAEVAMVSGSGPTVLGLFAGADGRERARQAATKLGAEGVCAHAAYFVDAAYGAPQAINIKSKK
jgi:4-diphosphocytidyl-2-C-methyl-D-erythritol kinase